MGVDPLSIVDPARVRILVVPIGRIKHSRFLGFLERFKQENVIQLRDVSPDSRPHTTTFSPLAFPAGRVLFDIGTSVPPAAHLALCPFELYRQPLAVVAVADSQNLQHGLDQNDQKAYEHGDGGIGSPLSEESIQSLLDHRQQLASDFSSALVHEVIVFDHDGPNQNFPRGISGVPSPAKSKTTTIKTVMCDLTSQLLAEMTSFARSIQGLSSLESPKTPGQNIHRPLARYGETSRPASSERSQQSSDGRGTDHRMSMPAHLLANRGSRSGTPEGRPISPPGGTQTPPTDVNGSTSTPSTSPSRVTDRSRPMSRDRASLQGFGSNSLAERERKKHRGRIGIVIGLLYLLAGRWPDAVKELSESGSVAKANNDHVWHGKALDYLLVTSLLYAWAGLDFQIPALLHAALEKPGSGSGKASKDTPSSSHVKLKSSSVTPSRDSSLHNLSHILPELVTVIQNLYSRAWTFSEDKLPQLSFSESGLRFSRLLTVIEASKGKFTDLNLQQAVLGVKPNQDEVQAAQLTTFPSKAEITTFLFRSFPSPGVDDSLTVADRTRILAGIAFTLGELGYHRKKAFVLKELLEGLIPALVAARKRGAAEMGVHPAASLVALDAAVLGARDTQSQVPYGEDEMGIRGFLSMVCSAYGIHTASGDTTDLQDKAYWTGKDEQTPLSSNGASEQAEIIIQRAIQQAANRSFASLDLKIDILRLCTNICEALPDLEGVLDFSAELLRTAGSGIAPGPDDNHGSPSLSIDDQLRLWNNISRTVAAARQLGLEHLAADYWDEFLVRGIVVVPSASNHPTAHAKDDLEYVAKSTAEASSGPFLYNPFAQSNSAKTSKPLVVAGEEAAFRVTLQNLYDFDLEIESIRLVSQDDECDAPAQALTVGPYRTQSVFLTATWSESGTGIISGCIAKIRGCRERFFPIFEKPWSLKSSVKASHAHRSDQQPEISSQARESPRKDTRAPKGPVPSSLSLDVIPALPAVMLKKMSLFQSAIMLLEGETKSFNITLYNASKSVTADLILPTFKDSTAAQLQAAMANKKLTASELYELELAAAQKPLRWLREDDDPALIIWPGKEATLRIEVTGKPGLSDASILISYGHLGVPRSEHKDRFYTRQLSIPLTVTVNASIDITRAELLPFNPSFAWQNQQRQSSQSQSHSAAKSETSTSTRSPSTLSTRTKSSKSHHSNSENRFQALLSRISSDKPHCLFSLDCRNSWSTPLSLSIQIRPPAPLTSTPKPNPQTPNTTNPLTYTVHESLQPNQTKRILLLLPRIRLPNTHTNRPIPSLTKTNQQYVVPSPSSAPSSHSTHLAARQTFWYRETLLNHLHATWTEDTSTPPRRTGVINTRDIRFSPESMAVYSLPELEISMSVSSSPPSNERIQQTSPRTYTVPLSTPLVLTTTLKNHTPHPIYAVLRLQPHHAALERDVDLGGKFLVHGLLQRGVGVLQPLEEKGVEVGFCVVGLGRWEVGGVVEEVVVGEMGGEDDGEGGDEGFMAKRGRRVWGVEEGVVIVGSE